MMFSITVKALRGNDVHKFRVKHVDKDVAKKIALKEFKRLFGRGKVTHVRVCNTFNR